MNAYYTCSISLVTNNGGNCIVSISTTKLEHGWDNKRDDLLYNQMLSLTPF